MGLPCSKNSKPKRYSLFPLFTNKFSSSSRLKSYSTKPSFSAGYDDTLKFKVEIGNIKARNLPAVLSHSPFHPFLIFFLELVIYSDQFC